MRQPVIRYATQTRAKGQRPLESRSSFALLASHFITFFDVVACFFDFPFNVARAKLSSCKRSSLSFSVNRAILTICPLDLTVGSYPRKPSPL